MRLAWTTKGSGPDVVLVPGMAVSRYLAATQDLLAEHATVHLLELPGTGRAVDPPKTYGLLEDVAEVAGWTARRLPRGALFVGHSYGSQVVPRLAVAAPGLVHGMVLASPTVDPAYRGMVRLLARWLIDTSREPPGLAKFQRPEQRRAGWRRMLRMVRTMLDDDPAVWLERADVPVTVVRGRRDAMCTPEWAAWLAEFTGGRLVEVPGAPHAFPFQQPEALAEATLGALEGAT
ncbi:hypothetical protein GCM10027569_27450 [Flindersiella endophytica]